MNENGLFILIDALCGIENAVAEGSLLWGVGAEVIEMISAYRSDTITFFERNDLINSIAAAYYARGWADSASALGLIITSYLQPDLFNIDFHICIKRESLMKKKVKYQNMLSLAITSIEVAPDNGSKLFQAAHRYLCVMKCALHFGNLFSTNNQHELSLGWYSYGHAWADLGIRAGLFRIKDKKSLFSV